MICSVSFYMELRVINLTGNPHLKHVIMFLRADRQHGKTVGIIEFGCAGYQGSGFRKCLIILYKAVGV